MERHGDIGKKVMRSRPRTTEGHWQHQKVKESRSRFSVRSLRGTYSADSLISNFWFPEP